MASTGTASFIRAGLLGLPLYGLLTLRASREPQPDPAEDYEAWSRFVTGVGGLARRGRPSRGEPPHAAPGGGLSARPARRPVRAAE